jgi:hypothetical protein
MLTKKDIHFLRTEFKQELLADCQHIFATKEEMITRFDAVMHELQGIREDMAALIYRNREHSDSLEDHEQRLVKLES